jgi:hypothetical protein
MGIPAAKVTHYLRYYPIALAYLLLGILVLRRRRIRWKGAIAGAGIVLIALLTLIEMPVADDFRNNWEAGRAWLSGRDPYPLNAMMNYPPYALPLFAVPAMLPFNTSRVLWIVVNLAAAFMLVPLSRLVLRASETAEESSLPLLDTALFAAVFCFSLPVHFSLRLGQPTIFVALCLFLALYARDRGWRIGAGALLGLAAVKPQTALPFLILFCRRDDALTWLAAGLTVVLLWFTSGPPAEWSARLGEMLSNAAALAQPGQINDYTDSAREVHSLLGFDRLLYCLGVTSRAWVRVGQTALTVGLGAWVIRQVVGRDPLQRGAAYSLVSLFALLFVYHRTYDTTLLALPFVWAVGLAVGKESRLRSFHVTTALAILAILFVHPRVVQVMGLHLADIPLVGLLSRTILMPYNMWLLLVSMAAISLAGGGGKLTRPAS